VGVVAALGEELDRLAVFADDADRAGACLGCPQPLGQDGVEDLLRRDRLGEALTDPLQPVRAIGGVLKGLRTQHVALGLKLHRTLPGRSSDCTRALPRIEM
jgi:hypothetical protein